MMFTLPNKKNAALIKLYHNRPRKKYISNREDQHLELQEWANNKKQRDNQRNAKTEFHIACLSHSNYKQDYS